ncbi:substrate-binding periplasmic protein [Terasakiella sp.]|uniref:substrate-binding periplasmic protein n=1 Tax=Terasakiella sp. TaxID=2034861 RepID=UPI003AA7D75D
MQFSLSKIISYSFVALIGYIPVAHANETVRLCYEDEDYAPYLRGESQQPAKPNPGVLVEITQAAFKEAGQKVQYIRRPWKRCMHLLRDGKIAGMFGVIHTKEREKIGKYPMQNGEIDLERRLLFVDYPIFYNAAHSAIQWDGQKFSGTTPRIGTPLGYATVKSLKNEHKITPNTSFLPETGLKLVSEGKLDGYIVEKNVGLSLLSKLGLKEEVIVHQPPFKRHALYLVLSHDFYEKNSKVAEKIWSTLAVLRKTVLDSIMKKYMHKIQ